MSGMLERGFLDDIARNIDDDTPRLVYADWLLDHGKDDRAEFIRVQIERARLPAWDPAQVGLRLREAALLEEHAERWLAELPKIQGAKWEGFRRGIVAEVSFTDFQAMRRSAHACRAVAPVEAVTVRWPRRNESPSESPIAELRELSLVGNPGGVAQVGMLADSPQLSSLRRLTARGIWAEAMTRLMASPHLAGLKSLGLPANNLGNAGLLALVQSASLTALEELDLSGRGGYEQYNDDPVIHSAGIEALVGWAGFAGVRALSLTSNDLRRPGLRALLRSPQVSALKELSVRGTRLDGKLMAEFADASPGLRLEVLDLGENDLRQLGAEYVALAPCLCELKSLQLDRCEIPRTGAVLLAKKAKFLDGLRVLVVGFNHFGPAGLEALLNRRPPALHTLWMRDNDVFDNGAEVLAASDATDGLIEVDLSENGLGDHAAEALGNSEHLGSLLVLRLADNRIGESAAAALADSPLGKRLAVLETKESAPPDPSGEDAIPF